MGHGEQSILGSSSGVTPATSMARAVDLDKNQRILTKVEVQDAITKGDPLRNGKCGFAVELFSLRRGWVFGLTHCGPLWQHVAVVTVHSLNLRLRIGRNADNM